MHALLREDCPSAFFRREKRAFSHRVPVAGGERLASLRQGALCLDTLGGAEGSPVGLFVCHGAGGNQHWSLASRLIAHGGLCVTLDEQLGSLLLRPCGGHPSQVRRRGIVKMCGLKTRYRNDYTHCIGL